MPLFTVRDCAASSNQYCRILLELDPTSDPVWIFFDTQHSSIKKVLQKSHAGAAAKFEGSHQILSTTS